MTTGLHARASIGRRTVLKSGAGMVGVLALSGSASAVVAQEDAYDESPEDGEEFPIPQLNVDTMTTELEGETLPVVSYEELRPGSTTYVGAVPGRSDLFVGVSLLDAGAEGPTEADQPDIVAYLCDGTVGSTAEVGVYLWGEYDEAGVTLTGEAGTRDEDATVELTMGDGEFLGAVTLAGEESHPFLATEATGDAGMYVAAIDLDPDEFTSIHWVVLPDGRQRGVGAGMAVGVRAMIEAARLILGQR